MGQKVNPIGLGLESGVTGVRVGTPTSMTIPNSWKKII